MALSERRADPFPDPSTRALTQPTCALQNPWRTSGSGKVTVFNGNEKTEAPLALVGEKLEARGSFKVGAGAKVLAEVSLNGKPAVAARFTLKWRGSHSNIGDAAMAAKGLS